MLLFFLTVITSIILNYQNCFAECEQYYCKMSNRHFELITVDNYVKGQTFPGCTEVTSDSSAPAITQTWSANTTYRIKDSAGNNVSTPCKKWSPEHERWYIIGASGSSVITSEYHDVIIASQSCPADDTEPPQTCQDQDQDGDGCPDACDPWPEYNNVGSSWGLVYECDTYMSYVLIRDDGTIGDSYYNFGDYNLADQNSCIGTVGGEVYDFNELCSACDCNDAHVSGSGSPQITLQGSIAGGLSGNAHVSNDQGVDAGNSSSELSLQGAINENLKLLLQGQITEQDYLAGIQKSINMASIRQSNENQGIIAAVNGVSQTIISENAREKLEAQQAASDSLGQITENQYDTDLQDYLPESKSISELLDNFVSNNSMTSIVDSYHINLNGAVCSVEIPLWGSTVEYSLCEYESILSTLGYIILFVSGLYSLFILVGKS